MGRRNADDQALAGLRRLRLDLVDLAVLGAFAGLSMWVVALNLEQVIVHGRTWTGTDGGYGLPDQMQHLAWIRDASSHVLVSNLFVLGDTPHNYIQPAVAVSAALTAIGLAPWVALLLWKPVAVTWLFLAVRAYVRRVLVGTTSRRLALVLALFFVGWGALVSEKLAAPGTVADVRWLFITNDSWLAFWSWGYLFALLSVGAFVSALLVYGRNRAAGRIGWAAPLLGAVSGWLHPWQGMTLILLLVCTEALMWVRKDRPSVRLPVVTVLVWTLPFLYYALLRQTDQSWKLGQNAGRLTYPLLMLALTLLPLALPAAFAYRSAPRGFLPTVTRVWPPAAVATFFLCETPLGRGPTHALLGVTIPLAVLSVEGGRKTLGGRFAIAHARALGALVVIALIVPPTLNAMWDRKNSLFQDAAAGTSANFIASGERRALDFLARDDRPGGVVTGARIGTIIPAETGRHTYVGNFFWSRDFFDRTELTNQLFVRSSTGSGQAQKAAASLSEMSGARFILADCQTTTDLRSILAQRVESVRRFGCAIVYALNPTRSRLRR